MRDQKLETLRGLALLCLLTFHAESGSWVDEHVRYSVIFVMMPLFAAISGTITGMRPLDAVSFSGFACGKLLRIGLPMICCLSLLLVMLYAWPAAFSLLYPAGPPKSVEAVVRFFMVHPQTYWFLQAILVIFLVVGLADSRGDFSNPLILLLALAGSSVFLMTFAGVTGWLSLDGVQFLMPYFLLGFGFGRFGFLDVGKRYRWPVMISALLFMVVVQLNYFVDYGMDFSQGSVLGVLGSLLLTSALFFWGGTISWLAKLGGCSYGIYLFHRLGWVLGMLIIPFSPQMLGLDLVLHVLLMLGVGFIATWLLQRTAVTRFFFLGGKFDPARLKSTPAS
jgi:peptidoglycan/LPS O-acetylase OafA/YrhL